MAIGSVIRSRLDTSSDDYKANFAAMQAMWDGVAADYVAVMTPAEGVVGLYIADESGTQMAFFYCEHSWYRVETGSGKAPPMDAVVSLRTALGCSR